MCSAKSRGGLVGRGMTDSVRHMWVLSMSSSARVHEALLELTDTKSYSSGKHVELGASRMKIDHEDCEKFCGWLRQRNPFVITNPNLHSLSTGIVSIAGKDDVDCERAEEIGQLIQSTFSNLSYSKCSLKRKDIIKNLSTLYTIKKNGDTLSTSNNQMLFLRLIAVSKRLVTLESAFEYELAHEPMSVFKNGAMRKSNKSAWLKDLIPECCVISSSSEGSYSHSIIDNSNLCIPYTIREYNI